ncbi:hypothetical protein RA2_04353 [Roseovarius sp. A-2]|uniref:hypothetical protein n=1 Tax=Roseovarius sp. A-2 TaxID=1570360 RepID=UPI0009B500BE|nr:hypothetical protein [Roseovarius sp. A-2]GAW37276.1 hypothetical protein RA2_04353 [Roseovarius sp. A-2]
MPKLENIKAKLRAARAIPPAVRAAMSRVPDSIEPGAIDVMNRFYEALRRHRQEHDCPPRACFDQAAKSEPTLGTLLRGLERFAPDLNLAEGRAARTAWYKRRKGAPAKPAAATNSTEIARPPAQWPSAWHTAHARLFAESPKESTAKRHVSSLNRCAEELDRLGLTPIPDRFRALVLSEAFSAQGLSPRTVRNYLGAFVRLAQCLDADPSTLDGLANIFDIWVARAARAPKHKDLKLDTFAENGGSWQGLLDTALDLCTGMDAAGGSWRASDERARLQACVLLIALNTNARTGDIAAWRLGEELKRREDGSWSLRYLSIKTGKSVKFSRLWPETHAALDALLLAGRPERMLTARYATFYGCSWMRHTRKPVPAKYPSALIKEITTVSAHPLRTLAADVLRRIDPGESPRKIAAWLGHHDPRSQEAYTLAATGRAQSDAWAKERIAIRKG